MRSFGNPAAARTAFHALSSATGVPSETANRLVVVLRARLARIREQLRHRLDGNPGCPAQGSHRHPFDQEAEDRGALLCAQPVHTAVNGRTALAAATLPPEPKSPSW